MLARYTEKPKPIAQTTFRRAIKIKLQKLPPACACKPESGLWARDLSPVHVQPCTAQVGPTAPTSRDPLEMFSNFFDDQQLSHIVTQTNRYAAQCLAATNQDATWEMDVAELKAFMIVMGVNQLPGITGLSTVG